MRTLAFLVIKKCKRLAIKPEPYYGCMIRNDTKLDYTKVKKYEISHDEHIFEPWKLEVVHNSQLIRKHISLTVG
jgi:hypothetical protein